MARPRLTPAMSSRKAIVLDFVTAYIRAHSGTSPSYSEIAAGCGLRTRQLAGEIVTALVVAGKLRRQRGQARGLMLPTDLEDAVRKARECGYIVIDAPSASTSGFGAIPLTFSTLPRLPDLDQIAGGDGGSGDDGLGAKRSGRDGPADDRG